MGVLEFISSLAQALAWPLLIGILIFSFRKKIEELRIEALGTTFQIKLLKAGPLDVAGSLSITHQNGFFRQYSNGVLVQDLSLVVKPGVKELSIIFPISFPKELFSIQVVGEELAWLSKTTLGNCELKIAPSNHEREIKLKITGM